jgi:hypothetical protein
MSMVSKFNITPEMTLYSRVTFAFAAIASRAKKYSEGVKIPLAGMSGLAGRFRRNFHCDELFHATLGNRRLNR